jgi:hypothetical protein
MSIEAAITSHVREIDRCNQRGGRFLSVLDLLDVGTVSPELAAYLGAAILDGHSFLVGAVPGGAGKTTVMGAFLNFVPPGVDLRAATEGTPGATLSRDDSRLCLICHEIGQGPYFGYLWGQDVRDFFELPTAGHMAATNLHADDVDQARQIICGGCGVSNEAFSSWPLFLFLRLEGRTWSDRKPVVHTAWEGPDRLVYQRSATGWDMISEPSLGRVENRREILRLLEDLNRKRAFRLEDVRRAVLERFSENASHP